MTMFSKSEFAKHYGKSASWVSNLIKAKKIKTNTKNLIDDENPINKFFIENYNKAEEKENNNETEEIQTVDSLSLEMQLLQEKLTERQQKNQLQQLKLASAQKQIVEYDVLSSIVIEIFEQMFKELTILPEITALEIIALTVSQQATKEQLSSYLTAKILEILNRSLDKAKKVIEKNAE